MVAGTTVSDQPRTDNILSSARHRITGLREWFSPPVSRPTGFGRSPPPHVSVEETFIFQEDQPTVSSTTLVVPTFLPQVEFHINVDSPLVRDSIRPFCVGRIHSMETHTDLQEVYQQLLKVFIIAR